VQHLTLRIRKKNFSTSTHTFHNYETVSDLGEEHYTRTKWEKAANIGIILHKKLNRGIAFLVCAGCAQNKEHLRWKAGGRTQNAKRRE